MPIITRPYILASFGVYPLEAISCSCNDNTIERYRRALRYIGNHAWDRAQVIRNLTDPHPPIVQKILKFVSSVWDFVDLLLKLDCSSRSRCVVEIWMAYVSLSKSFPETLPGIEDHDTLCWWILALWVRCWPLRMRKNITNISMTYIQKLLKQSLESSNMLLSFPRQSVSFSIRASVTLEVGALLNKLFKFYGYNYTLILNN